MARLLFLAPFFGVLAVGTYWLFFKGPPPLPDLALDEWWGPENTKTEADNSIRPFKIRFKESLIHDLRHRIQKTRPFTPALEGVGFEYGFHSQEIDGWLRYWAEKYNFVAREKFLNQYPSYKTNIQGLDIHFIRVKPDVPKNLEVIPLLLIHGWPGSVREFYESIPLLTAVHESRDFAIEVIIPSLPGYGFSDAAVRPGLGAAEISVVLRNLMHRLGYNNFYVQGGDWGSIIGSHMATLFSEEILGYHSNLGFSQTATSTLVAWIASFCPSLFMNEAARDRMYPQSAIFSFLIEESGYMHIQSTKPDTVGVALSDSPAGLLTYILEKFSTWTDRSDRSKTDGGLSRHFTKDQLLDNLMFYWTTNSITTSMRLYAETFNKRHFGLKLDEIPTSVPTWLIQAKNELAYQAPFILKLKYPNLIHETMLDDGGHFLALQLPAVFAEDVLKAIDGFRRWRASNKTKSEL